MDGKDIIIILLASSIAAHHFHEQPDVFAVHPVGDGEPFHRPYGSSMTQVIASVDADTGVDLRAASDGQ